MVDRLTRPILIGLEVFLGLTALYGAVAVVPTLPTAWLAGSPFRDFTIPALALGAVGGGALAAAVLLLIHHPAGSPASWLVGLAITIFEVVETMVGGLDIWLHALGLRSDLSPLGAAIMADPTLPRLSGIPIPLWLQPFFFLLGIAMMLLARHLATGRIPGRLRLHPVGR